jgi:glycosyltransferase involved in cell wall biosynthesis
VAFSSHPAAPLTAETSWPSVSVVVPTRNRVAQLLDCVRSLLAQDYPSDRYELIVVHNGSSGGVPAELSDLAQGSERPPVRCLELARADANAARNAGVAAAGGEIVCFVDDDAVAPTEWLGALVAGVLRHPQAGCVGGPIKARFEHAPPRTCDRHELAGAAFDAGERDKELGGVWGSNMAVPRSGFELAGEFREGLAFGQDWEWQQRLQAAGGQVLYVPDAWLWHRRSRSDLRIPTLLREYVVRGWVEGRLHRPTPESWRPGALARGAIASLAHGLRRLCIRGLTDAARHAGRLAGVLAPPGDSGRPPIA